jgi:hypothetical protein
MAVLSALVSVHTDDPGETGANEVPGRKSTTFKPDGEGTFVVFDLEAGTYSHVGLWSNEGEFLGSATLGATLDVAGALILSLSLAEGTLTPPVDFAASTHEAAESGFGEGTFSYWEKRRKDFGPMAAVRRREYMPFRLEVYREGVTIVRYPDGTFAPVREVTEELEAVEGVRIYYGGKQNSISSEEADELEAAGYGDFVTVTAEDAYNQGPYGEGNYGS